MLELLCVPLPHEGQRPSGAGVPHRMQGRFISFHTPRKIGGTVMGRCPQVKVVPCGRGVGIARAFLRGVVLALELLGVGQSVRRGRNTNDTTMRVR